MSWLTRERIAGVVCGLLLFLALEARYASDERVNHTDANVLTAADNIGCLTAIAQRLAILADDSRLVVTGVPDEHACDEPAVEP